MPRPTSKIITPYYTNFLYSLARKNTFALCLLKVLLDLFKLLWIVIAWMVLFLLQIRKILSRIRLESDWFKLILRNLQQLITIFSVYNYHRKNRYLVLRQKRKIYDFTLFVSVVFAIIGFGKNRHLKFIDRLLYWGNILWAKAKKLKYFSALNIRTRQTCSIMASSPFISIKSLP